MKAILQKAEALLKQIEWLAQDLFKLLGKIKIAHVSSTVKYAAIISVTFVGGMWVHKTYEKVVQKDVFHLLPTYAATVTAPEKVAAKTEAALKDTTTPKPTIFQKPFENTIKPDTVIRYVPIPVKDSAAFASVFGITHLTFDQGALSADAINLKTREYRHYSWCLSNANFEMGTNSQEVWILEHKQWIAWDGLFAGARWDGGLKPVITSGLTFFHKVNLSVSAAPTEYSVDLTWKIF